MPHKFRVEIVWALFALVDVVAMFVFPEQVTIPFHVIWISLTLVYGYRTWNARPTLIVLAVVMLVTGLGEASHSIDIVELFEVPLMATMFLAMVWHAAASSRSMSCTRRRSASGTSSAMRHTICEHRSRSRSAMPS